MSKSKIITVTANTAIDYIIHVKNLNCGDNQIAESSLEFAAGKGINVAKTIVSLGGMVKVLGFVGKKSQATFAEIASEQLHCDYTLVEGKTRTNITLADSFKQTETHIRTQGFVVNDADCNRLMQKLEDSCGAGDSIILSGSLPDGAMPDLYRRMIELCQEKSARAFLDSSGDSLKHGLKARPFLIKPNQQEFETLLGKTFENEAGIIEGAREIIAEGVKMVLVSRAKKGAMLISENEVFTANVDCSRHGNIVSNIGCGDAMLAGFVWAMSRGFELKEALKVAISCGAANLFSLEPGRLDNALVQELTRQCQRT